jgi:hypothetical protein
VAAERSTCELAVADVLARYWPVGEAKRDAAQPLRDDVGAALHHVAKYWSTTSRSPRGLRLCPCTSKLLLVTIYSPVSSQVLRMLVMCATTSIALASRLPAGLNKVMSPVAAGIATDGQAVRVAVMPLVVISPSDAQPSSASDKRTGIAALGLITNIGPQT